MATPAPAPAPAPEIITSAKLIEEFKRTGRFDEIRKNLLEDFSSSPSGQQLYTSLVRLASETECTSKTSLIGALGKSTLFNSKRVTMGGDLANSLGFQNSLKASLNDALNEMLKSGEHKASMISKYAVEPEVITAEVVTTHEARPTEEEEPSQIDMELDEPTPPRLLIPEETEDIVLTAAVIFPESMETKEEFRVETVEKLQITIGAPKEEKQFEKKEDSNKDLMDISESVAVDESASASNIVSSDSAQILIESKEDNMLSATSSTRSATKRVVIAKEKKPPVVAKEKKPPVVAKEEKPPVVVKEKKPPVVSLPPPQLFSKGKKLVHMFDRSGKRSYERVIVEGFHKRWGHYQFLQDFTEFPDSETEEDEDLVQEKSGQAIQSQRKFTLPATSLADVIDDKNSFDLLKVGEKVFALYFESEEEMKDDGENDDEEFSLDYGEFYPAEIISRNEEDAFLEVEFEDKARGFVKLSQVFSKDQIAKINL